MVMLLDAVVLLVQISFSHDEDIATEGCITTQSRVCRYDLHCHDVLAPFRSDLEDSTCFVQLNEEI